MLKHVALLASSLALFAALVRAQTGVGQIQGTVTDASGAVVPNASVVLENIRTDTRLQTISSAVGFYVFPSLTPGDYRITITAPGMQKWEGTVTLVAGQRAVVDASLVIGRAAEQVTVAGDVTPLLSTTSPTGATIVEHARIEQLPLNGRSIQTLLTIAVPGLEGNASQPKVYGLRDSAMDVLQDGVTLQDRNTGAIQSRPPGLDTIEEFRVETAVSSAKLTRPSSAMMITKSGTNDVHGAAFETGRNSGFGVARQRQDTFTKAPHLVRNEFGASLGGPVYVPRLYNGRNRTFFFAAWEELRQRQAATTTSAVWTGAMRQGDFNGLVDSQNRRITLYDPWSVGAGPSYIKTPYVNNQLPMSRESPLARYMFGVTPSPTNNLSPLVGSNLTALAPVIQNQRTFTFRVDHNISDKDRVYGRYSPGHWDLLQRRSFSTGGFPITSDGLYNRETYLELSHTAMASWSHTFGPSFFVENDFNTSLINWQYSYDQAASQQNISAMFGTPNPFNQPGAPYINNALYQGVSLNGIVPRTQYTKVFDGEQNYSWTRGNHQVEFGWRYQQEILDTLPDAPEQSILSYNSYATALYNPATGSAFGPQALTGDNGANFFLGAADAYQQTRRPQNFNMRGKDVASYLQDNWKIRRDLVLNLGVRWEYLGPYIDQRGMTAGWDFADKALVRNVSIQEIVASGYTTQAIADQFAAAGVKYITPAQAHLPQDIVSVSKHDFSPRLGFAWNPRGHKHLVIRGGYGIYYFPIPARTFSELRLNPPMQGTYRLSWNDPAYTVDGLPNSLLRYAPDVITGINSANAIRIAPPTPGIQMTALNPDLPTARAHQYNFTIEHEIARDTVVRAGFIGTAGRHLEMMELFNRNPISNYVWYVNTGLPLPTGTYANTARRAYDQTVYGDIRVYSKFGYSNFTGVQLEAERRFSKGMAFQFFYLLSNSMSTGATPSQGGDFTVNGIEQPDRFLPGAYPSSVADRERFYRYSRDGDIPKHHIRFNYLYDLPIGRGKRLFGNVGTKADRLVGGWQVAGYGSTNSRWVALPATNWGSFAPVNKYGLVPINDCRGGACFTGYLYYNGYLPATVIADPATGRCAASATACVFGAPAGYVPVSAPINPAVIGGDPNFNNTNNVYVPLKNGARQLVNYDTGLNSYRNQWFEGPWLTNLSASVYKTVALSERVKLRINLDAFNVLNQPGLLTPSSEGITSLRFSAQGARVLQYTARITW